MLPGPQPLLRLRHLEHATSHMKLVGPRGAPEGSKGGARYYDLRKEPSA